LAGTEVAAWTNKTPSEWTESDAKSFLGASPWVRAAAPALLPGLSQFQRRDSGNFEAEGGGKSAGFGLSDLTGYGLRDRVSERTDLDKNGIPRSIQIRWESALPVRVAEIKAKDENAPVLDGEDYAIAVYNVPLKGAMYNLDPRTLKTTLKQNAALKEDGKKDFKPSKVILRQDGSEVATMIYLFPRTDRISADDQRVEFVALVGRLYLAQYFYPPQMVVGGKLEL
jgi:hypothetical protein